MNGFRTVQAYCTHLMEQVRQSRYAKDWSDIQVRATSREVGLVRANSIQFRDGATLRFNEEIRLDADGAVSRPYYSYQYEREDNGTHFYFRYDRDPDNVEPIIHEECHLHVNQNEPRYKTSVTSFEEVFNFIIACYYSSP